MRSNRNLESEPDAAAASPTDLVDYVMDHGRQLANLALSAGRPKASALFTLAVTELRRGSSD